MKNLFSPRELVVTDRIPLDDIIIYFPRRPTVQILIVADTPIDFTSNFGLGKVIDIIRANVDGYVNFVVDLARLGEVGSTLMVDNSPAPKQPKYDNFRFSSQVSRQYVIEDYDEIWCFGFAPGNDGSSNDNNIWNSRYASTNDDLAVLTQWMNAGGGILAMGDHHYLGASMCAKIPRIGTMRRWTNAQGVPPIKGINRLDTNRPQNSSQDPNVVMEPAVIPKTAETDDVPQIIEWKRYPVASPFVFERRYRPHPLLCGGNLGTIDVLPDHPHEGWVFEDTEINLGATYNFNGISGDEYPTLDAIQARPEVIAWGHTLPTPPYNHEKGESPANRFGVIGVYNGDLSGVGRVVVDSTWHHWLDMNITELEAESPNTEYQKIVRYYRNCAVWLARKSQRRQMFNYTTFWVINSATAFEDFVFSEDIFVLGSQAINVIGRMTSDCLVRDWIDIFIPERLREELIDPRFPIPDPCWSCPPIDLVQQVVLGGMLKEILPLRNELKRLHTDPKANLKLSEKVITEAMFQGAAVGLKQFQVSVKKNLGMLETMTDLGGLSIKRDQPRAKTVVQ